MQNDSKSKLPVFVFPTSIQFFVDDPATHKRILSLYNPYEYPIKYKILSTAPDKYIVNTPEGIISSHHRADVVVRLSDVKLSNCDVVDKFRILMVDRVNRKSIGKQDITATIMESEEKSRSATPDQENFQTMAVSQGLSGQFPALSHTQTSEDTSNSPSSVILVVALVCIAGLLLPTEKEAEPTSLFQISVGLKLVFAYVLGLVTWVILKTR